MYGLIRRSLDIFVSATGLLIFLPLMAAIAVWIRIDSPGAVIFRQNRVGFRGKVFTLYKFRTMRTDTDPYGFSPKDENDPRVTASGRFLRRYSLDELPQLVNVLRGQMTLVGPRPLLPWQYERWTDRQKKRCDVKPGLTGWAQIRGRGALTHEDKIELDLWYIEHASLMLDLKILWETIFRVLRSEDVLEVKYSKDDSECLDKSKESQ
ncbi:MAG: sugar transferase [Phycisphaerae bacterium]|nr:sugar transferase [Phycisphaerae bacterium]